MCGEGVCNILVSPLVARCLDNRCMYMAHVYFYVCVGVCGNVIKYSALGHWSVEEWCMFV